MLSKFLLSVVSLLCISQLAFAKSQAAFDDSVMMPGSRLLAGDLTKNEFYILAKNESEPPRAAPVVAKAVNDVPIKRHIPKIKMAMKEVLQAKPSVAKSTFKPVIKEYHQVLNTAAKKNRVPSGMQVSQQKIIIKKSKPIHLAAASVKPASYKVPKVKSKSKVKTVLKEPIKRVAVLKKKPISKQA